MGTSSNQPSPARDPSWIAARKVLGNPQFSPERQSQEIWRAATSDAGAQLRSNLGASIFATGAAIAANSRSVSEALNTFNQKLAAAKVSTIYTEIGARALARAVKRGAGTPGFAAELFAETVSYYVSRDLPSFVGSARRTESVSAAISLKQSLAEKARAVAFEHAKDAPSSAIAWRRFVEGTLAVLRGDSK
jgi:hypothetical protein